MSGRRLFTDFTVRQPLLGNPVTFPLLLLTVVSGAFGWLVWEPYGVLFGVLPPAVVFSFAFIEVSSSQPPSLPSARPSPPTTLDGRVDLATALYSAGIFDADSEHQLTLSEQFGDDWRERMVEVDGREQDREALAALLGVDSSRVEMDWDEHGLFAQLDHGTVGRWSSRAAFVADLTAVRTFRRHYPEWWKLSTADRNRVLGALRLSLRTCPTCDGTVEVDTDRVSASGSSTQQHISARCRGCNAELFDGVVDKSDHEMSGTDSDTGVQPHSTR
ncbi:hypothetical protein E6P09_12250 [Haloferax mediterranei ATCC 33500]|uniref:Uncharacterized protein n=1 Tax=Haloferax mediterranei (strain ATCC 33500 / DSM 1411 / JCM 8866 / NBRC 14739 / NCIMB 2177 / R-4) TaxID=523841 RepID=I3R8L6_HALMT|nr:hypothetical protein [Haloferax mediterranei]AFK20576.1 hypothetical protein HFX_2906 [Haloferax mediterranei ATCC 33500]ELZ98359.1 hypothetical protein C439_16280 [Haloferax mediterranei ATCC 33500]MDX5986667.1 hypothetical protein [Haloferax mediterranei ATCC 33500]QCQ75999.1 hypothetical protein E6P09_12250 [Haloferax mediterranei ATCC 33500]